jgi:pSer/pThr/pTyr-binding forkhead associated (FHA) protein
VPTLTLAFKGNTLQVIPLHDGLMTIGREPSCDIHIDSLAISPQHARLLLRDGTCTLQNNTGEETFVNHLPVSEQVLQDNDLIRIGKHTLRYANDGGTLPEIDHSVTTSAPEPVSEPMPTPSPKASNNCEGWLQVLSGSHLGKTIKLRSGMTDLGKLGIAPALISLRHDGYYIANLGEDDNLRVGDENIGEKTWPLKDGDLIQINKLKLQFLLEQ